MSAFPPAVTMRQSRPATAILSPGLTMVCFAFIDPVLVGNDDYPPPAFATRMTGYAVGFFFFWLVASLSSLITLYLVRTAHPEPTEPGIDEGTRSPE